MADKFSSNDEVIRNKFSKTEFVSYLSNYNSNLVTFAKPTPIELEVTDQNFRALFEKFIFLFEMDSMPTEVAELITVKQQLNAGLYLRIKEHVNLNKTITTKEVPTLLVPSVKINFIGQNNLPVAGQEVDFENTVNSITNSISRLISLIKAFDMENKRGQYYIIGKEPDQKLFGAQHDNWQHIRKSNLIDFVDVRDVGTISDYIHQHGVRPFVEE